MRAQSSRSSPSWLSSGLRHGPDHRRSSISQAWSRACHADRRIAKRAAQTDFCRKPAGSGSPCALAASATRNASRSWRASTGPNAPAERNRPPSAERYAESASRTCCTIDSRSRPPPRGPLRRSTSRASSAVRSNAAHAPSSSPVSRDSSSSAMGSPSLARATPGAPKSVVAFPVNRSETRRPAAFSRSGRPRARAPRASAYLGRYSASVIKAASSSRPARHHPGQSVAAAKARLAPTSR